MRNIIGAFGTLMMLAIYFFSCIAVGNAGITVAAAKEFKADVVAEIENSNFNPKVIEGCIKQAEDYFGVQYVDEEANTTRTTQAVSASN